MHTTFWASVALSLQRRVGLNQWLSTVFWEMLHFSNGGRGHGRRERTRGRMGEQFMGSHLHYKFSNSILSCQILLQRSIPLPMEQVETTRPLMYPHSLKLFSWFLFYFLSVLNMELKGQTCFENSTWYTHPLSFSLFYQEVKLKMKRPKQRPAWILPAISQIVSRKMLWIRKPFSFKTATKWHTKVINYLSLSCDFRSCSSAFECFLLWGNDLHEAASLYFLLDCL